MLFERNKILNLKQYVQFEKELKSQNSPISTTIINPYVVNTGMFKGFYMKFTKW